MINFMKKKLSTKQKIIRILIVTAIICIGILSYSYSNVLGKLLYLYVGITFCIPVMIFYAKTKLLYNLPNEKLVIDNNGNIEKVNRFKGGNYKNQYSKQGKDDIKYKPSESPNTQLNIYKQVSKAFNYSIRQKLLKRNDIIRFKQEINKFLNTNISHYQGFKFQNDAHEIYVKLKNRHLNESDYEYLLNILNELIKNNGNDNLKEAE